MTGSRRMWSRRVCKKGKALKNIQVIDGALNAAYDIWAVDDELFGLIFPEPGQNIEFIEDFTRRVWSKLSKERRQELYDRWWENPVPKHEVRGIHGTLFYELKDSKAGYYPTKRESDLNAHGRIGWDHP